MVIQHLAVVARSPGPQLAVKTTKRPGWSSNLHSNFGHNEKKTPTVPERNENNCYLRSGVSCKMIKRQMLAVTIFLPN